MLDRLHKVGLFGILAHRTMTLCVGIFSPVHIIIEIFYGYEGHAPSNPILNVFKQSAEREKLF